MTKKNKEVKKGLYLNNIFNWVGGQGSHIYDLLKERRLNEETITKIEEWKKEVIELCDENILVIKKYLEIKKRKENELLK